MHVSLHDVTGDNRNSRDRERKRSRRAALNHPSSLVRAGHHRTPISTTLLITRTDRTTPGEGIAWNGRRSGLVVLVLLRVEGISTLRDDDDNDRERRGLFRQMWDLLVDEWALLA